MIKRADRIMAATFLCFCVLILVGSRAYAENTQDSDDPITKIVAFGDSYSDNGEAKRITTEIFSHNKNLEGAIIKPSDALYWMNRYSNGETAVEILARRAEVPLENYATGGAMTGYCNYSAWMDVLGETGLLGQIDRFENSLAREDADTNAMYFIFASANDYFYYQDYNVQETIETIANETVAHIQTSIEKLTKIGAKKIMIVNSSDLSLVPYNIMIKRTADAKEYTDYVNKKLPEVLEKMEGMQNRTIRIFDIQKVSSEILKNQNQYGISVRNLPCQSTYPKIEQAKENPDSYYFWDEWHYSRVVHELIGNAMYKQYLQVFN